MNFPILEYDPSRTALIEPADIVKPQDTPAHCVICFFREVIDHVIVNYGAHIISESCWEDGPHPVYEITYHNQRLAFFHPGVGAPTAAAMLEEAIVLGARRFMVCGGCGVLVRDMAVGKLIVVSSAVRDEGVSYHYLPPGREVIANEAGLNSLVKTLTERGYPFQVGKTWTTDAPYRETAARISRRRDEGCLTVEMESASLLAVAQFRDVILGQVLYAGDDLSGAEWDNRSWQSRIEVRKNLFWLCADACLAIEE